MFKVIVKVEDVRFRTTFQSQIDIFSLKTDSIVPSSFLPESRAVLTLRSPPSPQIPRRRSAEMPAPRPFLLVCLLDRQLAARVARFVPVTY